MNTMFGTILQRKIIVAICSLFAVATFTGCFGGEEAAERIAQQDVSDAGYIGKLGTAKEKVSNEFQNTMDTRDAAIDNMIKESEGGEINAAPAAAAKEEDFEEAPKTDPFTKINMDLAETCGGAIIKTSKGDVSVLLYGHITPIAVANFCTLAQDGFYNGKIFHRVIKDLMIQGGDPTGTGTGGPGYEFEDEFNEKPIVRGSVAMANVGPGTNGSQFFFVTADTAPHLDGKHTHFGTIVEGIDVLDAIEEVETDAAGKPLKKIKIKKIELIIK